MKLDSSRISKSIQLQLVFSDIVCKISLYICYLQVRPASFTIFASFHEQREGSGRCGQSSLLTWWLFLISERLYQSNQVIIPVLPFGDNAGDIRIALPAFFSCCIIVYCQDCVNPGLYPVNGLLV